MRLVAVLGSGNRILSLCALFVSFSFCCCPSVVFAMSLVQPKQLSFREVVPTDLPTCIELEQASYPEDEAASKTTLQYRQHQAAPFFCCAIFDGSEQESNGSGEPVVGFVCATRCTAFTHESMTTHDAGGHLLAIHSVVVREDYRRQGVATFMLEQYIKHISNFNLHSEEGRRSSPIEKIVLLAKAQLLTLYINAGFRVVRLSPILHGSERWYELERDVQIPFSNYPCWVVDAFSDPKKRGTGNPAAVVIMPDDTDIKSQQTRNWMQTTAKEFNLAETAYVWRHERSPSNAEGEGVSAWHFNIRYFTPKVEVPLCGHASIASASVLFQDKNLPSTDSIVFHAAEDILGATIAPCTHPGQTRRGQRRVTMSFPSKPARELQSEDDRAVVRSMIEDAFSIKEEFVLWTGLSDIGDLLVEITSNAFETLGYTGLKFDALLETDLYSRGVILCSRSPSDVTEGGESNNNVDFASRFFAPKAGILEDPVTGSAHCVLAPYFCSMLDKATVIGHQRSERGGFVECTMLPNTSSGDNGVAEGRVEIVGLAVTTMSGKVH